MRIGFLSLHYLRGWSGVERLIAQLTAGLLQRGHDVIIIAEKPKTKPGASVPVTPVPDGATTMSLDLSTPEGRELAKNDMHAAGLDVAVGMFAGRDLLWLPWLFAGSGVPLVAAEALHPGVITFERWNPYEHYGALAAADFIQVLLPPYKNMYPRALQSRVTVIGNPCPAAAEFPGRDNDTPLRLLGIGRFEERHKRFTMFLRAWALLAPEFPGWQLTMVGDGPDYQLYRSLSTALGVDATVTFTGSVTDPGSYYAESDIMCMPSSQEGFALVLLEAAAYGLPMVGCRSCVAAAELIRPGMGALAESDSPAALADALRPLMSASRDERREMGERAKRFFEQHYAPELIIDQWEALLQKAVARRGRTRLDHILRERWNTVLLREAASELALRDSPLEPAPPRGAADGAAVARLTAERDALTREHRKLENKYAALLREYQAAAGGRRKH